MRKGPSVLLTRRARILTGMLVAVASVTVFALLDQRREDVAALDALSQNEALLARALSAEISEKLPALRDAFPSVTRAPSNGPLPQPFLDGLFARAGALEATNARVLLVARPGATGLVAHDGRVVLSSRVGDALAHRQSSVILPRDEATVFGLPTRAAVVGIAPISVAMRGESAPWSVVVAESALRERDRERRASLRLFLSLLFAAGLVVTFGGAALREQRRELELARALAVAAVERERDALLVRADKMATVAALSTGIAHEIATPLGVIVARVEQVLPKVENDARAVGYLGIVLEQVQHIERVVKGVLALSRGETPALEHVVADAPARSAVAQVAHRLESAKVALTLTVESHIPMIACDPPLLEQVLVNLLLNACDACRAGGEVLLAVRATERGVVFEVTDTGEGITGEAATRATEPFFTTKPKGGGTGLGLAIANEIVKHHGGTLKLAPRSPTGTPRGTLASVELPTR